MMLEVDVQLPWPPAALSPNARQHPLSLARAKKRYRHLCWGVALEQRTAERARVLLAGDERIGLRLEFQPPQRRSYDRDNLVSRMKAGIDGLADALQIDDGRFDLERPLVGEPVKDGVVRVFLRRDTSASPDRAATNGRV